MSGIVPEQRGRRVGAARSHVLAVLLIVAAASAPAVAGADRPMGRVAALATHELDQPAAVVRDYWTPTRMSAAEPVDLLIDAGGRTHGLPGGTVASPTATDASAANTAYPDRTHGRVFLTIEGGSEPGDYYCSGTVVESPGHTLVWTTGHCVNDAKFGGGFATNWMFVPGYRSGARPFGTWVADEVHTTRGWRTHANVRLDLGAATLSRDVDGRGIEDVVGARAIAFGLSREQAWTAFGYPSVPTLFRPEFNGERLYACISARSADDHPPGSGPATMEIPCDMTAGASGGGWVTADGAVNGVISYRYPRDFNHLYGPYFGAVAEKLHSGAGGEAVRCGDRPVTNLGGTAADSFRGRARDEAMSLGGGRDRARAAAGADELCGGKAGDRLRGEAGRDTLRGGPGRDLLRGGPGRDVCAGGRGRDRAWRCEKLSRVP